MAPYATIADIEARHPAELVLLAADETTGLVDGTRVEQAIVGATADIHGILFRRYTTAELTRLDAASLEILRTYAIDIALYRVALSFARSNERIKEARDAAISRLEAIADGKGGLSFTPPAAGGDPIGDGGVPVAGPTSPNEVVMVAPERVLTRDRLRGW